MFNDSLKELCSKKGGKYDFLSKSGYDFRNALFHLFKLVWKKEEIPTHWKHTTLVQLWKCKGDFRDQKYIRNLHIKEFEPKFFGHIVINLAKEILLKNTSIFQIGAKKGHRAAEHIYVMKSCIQMYKTLKKPLIICFWDYSTFFDSESEIDVMNEIYNLGVRGKLYRLLYKINQETFIRVKTAVGVTWAEKRSEGISQGTVDGAVLSSAGIGGGVDEYFRDSEHEIWYHEVRLQPQSFVDDVARMAAGRLEAQAGINLMETIAETKLLSYNMDKSVYMVVGEGGNKKGMEGDLEKDPLMLCGQKMKRTESYSYLGTAISEKGIGESVKETIKGKLGKVKHMIFEIKSVIEDFRNNVPGGICTGTLIWEAAVVPFLFHSSECWMEVPKESLAALNSLQEMFLRTLLAAPKTTPIVALYWEVGMPLAENRIINNKLLFFHHVVNLDQASLAFRVYQEQRRNIWNNIPSLTKECLDYLAILNINEDELIQSNKVQFRRLLKDKMKQKNFNDLQDMMKRYKKYDYLSHKDEEFEMKGYMKTMKLKDARTMFSLNSKTTDTIKSHKMSDKNYSSNLWECECGTTDSIGHVIRCVKYQDLRESRDLTNDVDLCKYFQDVICRRTNAQTE